MGHGAKSDGRCVEFEKGEVEREKERHGEGKRGRERETRVGQVNGRKDWSREGMDSGKWRKIWMPGKGSRPTIGVV